MAETKTVNGVTLEKLVTTKGTCGDCAAGELDSFNGTSCGGFADSKCKLDYIWKPISIVPRTKETSAQANVTSVVKQGVVFVANASEFGHSWTTRYLDDSPETLAIAQKYFNEGFGTKVKGPFSYVEHEGKTYLLGQEITLNEGLQAAIEQEALVKQAESKLSEEEKQALKQMWGVAK